MRSLLLTASSAIIAKDIAILANKLLVAKVDQAQTGTYYGYGYEATDISVAKTLTASSDVEVPTSKAIATYVANTHEVLNNSVVKTVVLHFTSSTEIGTSLSTTLPANSTVRRIAINVENPMASLTNFTVGTTSSTFVEFADVDPAEMGIYIVDLYKILSTESTVTATLTGAAESGSIYVCIDYQTTTAVISA